MQLGEMEKRPPYIRFEQRPVEDRGKTQETGIFSYKDVDYVLVTPHGSKDIYEEKADSWMAKQWKHVQNGRIPPQHYDYFKRCYENYKEGLEEPESGTPIKGWAAISSAQQQQILQANIRTIEDLAQAPEEALQAIGMGARALKQKAGAWLESADKGQSANRIQELENRKEELERQNEKQSQMIEELSARLERLEAGVKEAESTTEPAKPVKKKRGRPKKNPD